MAKREIIDYVGRKTGTSMTGYAWRSKPTRSPLTGRAVRCVVVQDDKGQFWAGARMGPGGGERCHNELWSEPFSAKDGAVKESRSMTRDFLSAHTEMAAMTENQTRRFKPGEVMASASMDDGWRIEIRAPERMSAAAKYAIRAFKKACEKQDQRQKLKR